MSLRLLYLIFARLCGLAGPARPSVGLQGSWSTPPACRFLSHSTRLGDRSIGLYSAVRAPGPGGPGRGRGGTGASPGTALAALTSSWSGWAAPRAAETPAAPGQPDAHVDPRHCRSTVPHAGMPANADPATAVGVRHQRGVRAGWRRRSCTFRYRYRDLYPVSGLAEYGGLRRCFTEDPATQVDGLVPARLKHTAASTHPRLHRSRAARGRLTGWVKLPGHHLLDSPASSVAPTQVIRVSCPRLGTPDPAHPQSLAVRPG